MKIEIPDRMIIKELNESIYGDEIMSDAYKKEETMEKTVTVVERVVDGLTDNLLAIMVVGSALWMSVNLSMIGDWHIAAVGAVLAYYFAKKP
jgi:hypothetical protein